MNTCIRPQNGIPNITRNTFVPGSNCQEMNNNNQCGCPAMMPVDYSVMGKDCGYGCDSERIAMAYVPWQKWKDVTDGCKGLAQGTIFNELNLSFNCANKTCGNCSCNEMY